MRGSVIYGLRLAAVAGVMCLAVGQYQAQARVNGSPRSATLSRAGQPADELLYQGKILPVVTDVYTSISNLGTALNNRSISGVQAEAEAFAREQLQLEAVHPIPKPLLAAEKLMDKGIGNLSLGTNKLAKGINGSNNTAVQAAATVLDSGIKQFESGVAAMRRLAGPVILATPTPGAANAQPTPTPIIKGLP